MALVLVTKSTRDAGMMPTEMIVIEMVSVFICPRTQLPYKNESAPADNQACELRNDIRGPFLSIATNGFEPTVGIYSDQTTKLSRRTCHC